MSKDCHLVCLASELPRVCLLLVLTLELAVFATDMNGIPAVKVTPPYNQIDELLHNG